MRRAIADAIILAVFTLFSISPLSAREGPDCIVVYGLSGPTCIARDQARGFKQARYFGTYTKAPKSQRKAVAKKPAKIMKTRTVPTRDRTVFTYSLNQQGDVIGFNSSSASCLPPEIKSKLTEISRRYGKVTIVSALRRGARVAGSGSPSYHASCRAVDFKVKGNQAAAARWLKQTHNGGVGTYTCAMHHIHIDNGSYRGRWHHCVNKNGRPIKRRG